MRIQQFSDSGTRNQSWWVWLTTSNCKWCLRLFISGVSSLTGPRGLGRWQVCRSQRLADPDGSKVQLAVDWRTGFAHLGHELVVKKEECGRVKNESKAVNNQDSWSGHPSRSSPLTFVDFFTILPTGCWHPLTFFAVMIQVPGTHWQLGWVPEGWPPARCTAQRRCKEAESIQKWSDRGGRATSTVTREWISVIGRPRWRHAARERVGGV